MIEVTVVLIEGGLPVTAVAPAEIFSKAGVLFNSIVGEPEDPRFQVQTASVDGDMTPTGVPLSMQPDGTIEEVAATDLVFVSAPDADLDAAIERNASLFPWLREWHERGAVIAGVCAGTPLLAEAGLLDGRPATTHWAIMEECRRRYPDVHWKTERFITESGDVYCGGGAYSAVDLSLYLVESYCGHPIAMQTAKALMLQTPRTWQAGYATEIPRITHDDAEIRDVQEWLFEHFSEEISVETLSSRATMSSRTFSRRFKAATGVPPIQYLQRLRVNASKRLLEDDLKTIQEISWAVGYEDAGFFRRLFKRHTGVPPQDYRERFGVSSPGNVAIVGRAPSSAGGERG